MSAGIPDRLPPGPPLLDVRGLHSGYGGSPVLFGIDLQVGAAEIVGLIGRNGMGKTTLVRSIMGLTRPTSGQVTIAGRATVGLPAHRVARLGLALVPEGRQMFANLSVEEHLSAFQRASPDGIATWTVARVFDLFPRLAERRRHMGNQLSGGEQQMLAIGRALVTNPKLLILDEATEGLAPLVREEIWQVLGTLRAAGHAMIVIDKYVQRLIGVADRHVIVEKGRVVWRGTSHELDADRAVWRRYLGV
jgi:branched-chain amino acid transport system ATP-binding protein